MRIIMMTAAVVLGIAALAAAQAPGEMVLFNGTDLTGWDGDPNLWSVKNGAITGASTKEYPAQGNTFLIWKGGILRDFELRVKFRLVNHNSGIQFRSRRIEVKDPNAKNKWVVGGYQADMDGGNTYTGILYEERGRGILAQVGQKVTIGPDGKPKVTGSVGDAKQIKSAIKTGDWNEYTIICQGNHIIQKINGVVTVDVTDEDEKRRAMEGILAFQLHAGPPMVVQFKDIVLKVLEPGK